MPTGAGAVHTFKRVKMKSSAASNEFKQYKVTCSTFLLQ